MIYAIHTRENEHSVHDLLSVFFYSFFAFYLLVVYVAIAVYVSLIISL